MGDHWNALSRSMVQHYTIKLVDCISLYICVVDFFLSLSPNSLSVSLCLSPSICLSVNLSHSLSVRLYFFNPWAHNISSLLNLLSYRGDCLMGKELDLQWAFIILFILISFFLSFFFSKGHLTLLFYAEFWFAMTRGVPCCHTVWSVLCWFALLG